MRTDEANIENDSVVEFSYFCKKELKSGSQHVLLCEHYIIVPWVPSLSNAGSSVMLYSYTFVFRTATVPDRHILGFPKNVRDFAVVPKTAGRPPNGFHPNCNNRFADMDFPSLKSSALISNMCWSTKKRPKPGTTKPLRRTQKNIRLTSAITQLFTSLEGIIIDPYVRAFSAEITTMGINQSFNPTEKDEVCFSASIKTILSSTECLHLDAFLNTSESVSASALGSASQQMSTTQCVNNETDD